MMIDEGWWWHTDPTPVVQAKLEHPLVLVRGDDLVVANMDDTMSSVA